MCLYIGQKATQEMKQSNKKFIYAWKVLQKTKDGWKTPYQNTKVEPSHNAIFLSNRKITQVPSNANSVHTGIHVYLNKKDALQDAVLCFNNEKVFRVKCYMKDFVAANWRDSYPSPKAVFTKVMFTSKYPYTGR